MKYAILAAGEGSRLAQEGIKVSKPMVSLGGVPLIKRLTDIFRATKPSSICIVANENMKDLREYLETQEFIGNLGCLSRLSKPEITYILRSTPSSMHSFYELAPLLRGSEPICATTVDTVFRHEEFTSYIDMLEHVIASGEADGLMGVTSYIDDEKPLYVKVNEEDDMVSGFLDSDPNPKYVSAGIYGLSPRALDTLQRCIERGESRMRNYQRALLTDGLRLKAFRFSKVIDIDHASDIAKAEQLLSE